MNINHDGTTVRFKTEPEELLEAEKSGAKSNTVRVLDADEYKQLRQHEPQKIIIQGQQEIFLRTISHVYVTDTIFGKYIAIFSWNPNEGADHSHTLQIPDHDPFAHTMSLDEQEPLNAQAINISLPLRETLDSLRGDKTYTAYISNLLAAHVKFEKQKGDVTG